MAVKFYKSLRGQEVYVNTLGFESYSHLFYFDKQPSEEDDSIERLMTDQLDRDAYFVIQVNKKADDVFEDLLRQGVIVRAMPAPLESWIRVTVGKPEENERFLHSLARVLRESRA